MVQGLLDWIAAIPDTHNKTLVQVGAWRGDATLIFAQHFKTVHDVDPYEGDTNEGYTMDDVYAAYVRNTGHLPNVQHYRLRSVDAAKTFHNASIDALYVDAIHTEPALTEDLNAWLPKVKDGGYVGGHDYGEYFPGIPKAVHKFFSVESVKVFQDCSWLVRV